MRIHHLRIQAFGPFAGEVEVDLDTLGDAGLFLLTGATGAGKTSVLDAVCFALYGAVPGDRQIAKRLRCDQAEPGLAPEVSMELTIAGRRFRIDRSPAWQRPKKRGSGSTTQQPSVLLQERVGGEWRALATRLDDAGHLVSGLLGMNLAQFCQVQMLPQGRFQAFLRAGSDERHRLLQQLFRTSRFEDVESWLRERRRSLRRSSTHHHDLVAALVSRSSEAAATPPPESWDLHALTPVADHVAEWVLDLHDRATDAARLAAREVSEAVAHESTARQQLEEARAVADRQERLARARSEHQALEADADAVARQEARLEAARRAAAVHPAALAAVRAEADHAAAGAAADEALSRVADLHDGEVDETTLPVLEDAASAGAARARALQPRMVERDALRAALRSATARLAQLGDELSSVRADRETWPATLVALREAEDDARRAAESCDAARREVDATRLKRDAARQVAELVSARAETRALHTASVDRAQGLREDWLDLQERRLTGMAAEIAGGLAVGASCPVCGSADHPHRAEPLPGAPDADAVRSARRAVDDAEAERHARAEALADLETRIAAARARADQLTVPVLDRELGDLEARLDRLTRRAARLDDAVAARRDGEERAASLAEQETTLATEEAGLRSSLAEREQRVADLEAELDALLDGSGHDDVSSLADALAATAAACATARRSASERGRAARHAHAAASRALELAWEHGFASPEEAAAATEAAGDLTALQQQVDRHRARRAAVASRLADPELVAAAALEPPDLAVLRDDHAACATGLDEARDRAGEHSRRATRLAGLRDQLVAALDVWRPVRDELDLADRLASLTDGTSPDNRLRMRLSGYVLAFRLRQVVAAANERLVAMTDRRYHLEHSGDRGAGETRGGLSLRVRDDWSGESRDPVTLSGGETFVVSLALALGLADVIAHEAGGAELDTLFVDEGFGTLDAETLDDVMDVLDSLREGGRVVGVVSHVVELRDRIPAQLHVEKRRTGSTLTLRA